MEIESSGAPIMSKKLWNKVKVVMYMLRKTLAKTKLLVDLHIKLKNGKLATKAFTSLLLHNHYVAFTCRCNSNNVDTCISPQEHILRSNIMSSYSSKHKSHHYLDDDNKIERVLFEASDDGCVTIEPSPLVLPTVVSHELKVAGSPVNNDEEGQVDRAAEEFIKNFYRQLQQQRITSVESPSPRHLRAL